MKKRSGFGKASFRMYVSYAATFLVPLLIMGVFSYVWTERTLSADNRDFCTESLDGGRKEIERRLAALDAFSHTVALTQWIQTLAYLPGPDIDETRMDPITLKNHLSELANYRAMNGFIENLAIYLHSTDRVLYPNGLDSFDWFFSRTYAFDDTTPAVWRERIGGLFADNDGLFVKAAPVRKYLTPDRLFVYAKNLPMRVGKPCATIFFTIPEKEIRSILEETLTNRQAAAYLYAADGTLLSRTSDDEELRMLAEGVVRKADGKAVESLQTGSGETYEVYRAGEGAGPFAWRYLMLFPRRQIHTQVQLVSHITLLVPVGAAALLLVAGLVLAVRITLRNYRPVRRLAQLVEDGLAGRENGTDDFTLIEHGIRSAIRSREELRASRDRYRAAVLKDLMEKLLDGQARRLGEEERRDIAGNGFDKPLFAVVALVVPDPAEDGTCLQEGACFGLDCPLFFVRRGPTLLVVINMEREQEMEDVLGRIPGLTGMPEATLGVGNAYPPEMLFKSYNEACTAIDDESVMGRGAVIRYRDIDPSLEKTYLYPVLHDKQLLEALDAADHAYVADYMRRMVRIYIHQSGLSLSMERLLFFKRVQLELGRMAPEAFGGVMGELRRALPEHPDAFDIQTGLENACKSIFRASVGQKETYSTDLAKSVQQYVDEHYADSSLSLTVLADRFHMGATRMSVFFKEQIGENFIDYLLRRRIHAAKQLLRIGGMTMEAVGAQVGFDNAHTFRRAFKKLEDRTPGQYREEMQEGR